MHDVTSDLLKLNQTTDPEAMMGLLVKMLSPIVKQGDRQRALAAAVNLAAQWRCPWRQGDKQAGQAMVGHLYSTAHERDDRLNWTVAHAIHYSGEPIHTPPGDWPMVNLAQPNVTTPEPLTI